MNKKISVSKISEFRPYLMGISILMIVFCHNTLYFDSHLLSKINDYLRKICTSGVDIFFLLSGLGLYFSYTKNLDLKQFYLRRFKRVIPPYLIALLIFPFIYMIILNIAVSDYPYQYYFERYSLSGFFINGSLSSWFVSSICVLYLVFPLLYRLINSPDFNKKAIVTLIIVIDCFTFFFSLTASGPFSTVNNIFISRIPTFLTGIYLGKCIYGKCERNISLVSSVTGSVIMLTIICLNFHFNTLNATVFARILFLPFVLFLIMVLCYLFEDLNNKAINRILLSLGGTSLEIYLVHEKTLEGINNLDKIIKGNDMLCSFVNNAAAVVFALLIAYSIKKALNHR